MQVHTRPRRFFRLLAAAVLCLPLFALRAAMPEFDKDDLDELTPVEREVVRQRQVREWSRRPGVKQKEYIRRLYTPLFDANKKDIERFGELAQKYRDRSRKALENGATDAAEKYRRIAKLCARRAHLSRQVVQALQEFEIKDFREAVERIPPVEDELEQVAGRTVSRSWFTPKEVRQASSRWPEILRKLRDED